MPPVTRSRGRARDLAVVPANKLGGIAERCRPDDHRIWALRIRKRERLGKRLATAGVETRGAPVFTLGVLHGFLSAERAASTSAPSPTNTATEAAHHKTPPMPSPLLSGGGAAELPILPLIPFNLMPAAE